MPSIHRDIDSLIRAVEASLDETPDDWKVVPGTNGVATPRPTRFGIMEMEWVPEQPIALCNERTGVRIELGDPAALTVHGVALPIGEEHGRLADIAFGSLARRSAIALLESPVQAAIERAGIKRSKFVVHFVGKAADVSSPDVDEPPTKPEQPINERDAHDEDRTDPQTGVEGGG